MIGALNRSIDSATSAIGKAIGRLSSGSSINSATDNPAGLEFETRMAVQISSAGAALSNVSNSQSLLQSAGGGLSQVADTLQRMRYLAVQAGDGSFGPSDRQALQAEFAQLSNSLDSTANQSQFNGQNLLSGTFSATVQTGPNSSDTKNISLGSVASAALGTNDLDITSAAGASNAVSAIDQALGSVSTQQGNVGALQSELDSTSANLSTSSLNLSVSRSEIADTNYAQTTSDLSQARVKQQVALKVIALYNANQSMVLGLFPGQSK